VGPGAGLERCRKSRPTGIGSPDLPARSESLYRLRYPGSQIKAGARRILYEIHKLIMKLDGTHQFLIYADDVI
jgi:hypothetical protein